MVTLAILAIVTSLAVGGYRQYMKRANRVDATSALLRLASAQEKFYAQNGQYADAAALAEAPPAGLGIAGTERGYYTLDIQPDADGAAVGFSATATVAADGPQADDAECWVFSVNERGLRGAETRDGDASAAITDRCWR
jgi:type IV pilus assembly protein PilE